MFIATEAIDRLHTTATSHNRMIICEVMGHSAGWLSLGAGIAGGADVILIPEIPYDLHRVADHLLDRRQAGKRFSIIAVAEGARSKTQADSDARTEAEARALAEAAHERAAKKQKRKEKASKNGAKDGEPPAGDVPGLVRLVQEPMASRLARELQHLTGTEARVTSLGHVQRGGVPTPADRLLCTRLGVRAAQLLAEGVYNVMVAVKDNQCQPVPLELVAQGKKLVPLDHAWLADARLVGTCLGEP
jgi:6-phosphofructokinase